jgi:hypothetical protein
VPPADAVTVAEPGATAVTVKVAVVEPDATLTDAGTVATPVLLLVNVTVDPPEVVSVTVPWPVLPAVMLAGLMATLATPAV